MSILDRRPTQRFTVRKSRLRSQTVAPIQTTTLWVSPVRRACLRRRLVVRSLRHACVYAVLALAPIANLPARGQKNEMNVTPAPQRSSPDLPLVPHPAHLTPGSGTFELSTDTRIVLSQPDNSELRTIAAYFTETVQTDFGLDLAISEQGNIDRPGRIVLVISDSASESGTEAYELRVAPMSVVVTARAAAGLFYGLQTLRQLIAAAERADAGSWFIPAVEIIDAPRFPYRGMHLDVGRHFFPVEFVKQYIDLLAMYKMNTFHWHLTEDQGWRIEIKKYPRLTQVGAYRKETILAKNFDPYIGDRKPYGGYYTQDEIRDVVEHARRRYVTVIPEIEMPGHSTAALAAYPELACTEGPFEVATTWGIHEDIYCPSDLTFAFLQDVLTEVMELFPGPYIHIGGDEAPKTRWEQSQLAQNVIQREGLADEEELQSYFIQRIEQFLLAHGRRLIGWDEILEGGLAPQATVMSWRGTAGGIEAARLGHDVIMTPTSHVYFDYYQGDPLYEPLAIGGYIPLEKVYAFEPVPEELTPDEVRHVLGAQANVWTEYMNTPQYVEYMVFPRMLALAEVVWSPREARDWNRFIASLPNQLSLLDAQRVSYRVPHVRGLERDRLTLDDRISISLRSLLPEAQIRYTTDGTDPTRRAPLYTAPLELSLDEKGTVVTARAFLPNERVSPARSARFAKTHLHAPSMLDPSRLRPGLCYAYFETKISSVHEPHDQEEAREGIATQVGLQGFERPEEFALEFSGYIRAPTSAVYTFSLTSDDGSELVVDDEVVVDNDGSHGPFEKSGMIALEAGYHPLTVRYFQAGGGAALSLSLEAPGRGHLALDELLFHTP